MRQSLRIYLLFFAGVALAGVALGQDLHFKTRTIAHLGGAPVDNLAVHKIVQYGHPPGTVEIESLLREGITVVSALPDDAILVSAPGGILKGADSAVWVGPMEAADKLSPALPAGLARDEVLTGLVEFHADVTTEQQDFSAGGVRLRLTHPAVLQGNHALITGTMADLRRLALLDEVAYIFPADPALMGNSNESLLTCAGMLTTNGPVGQYATIVHGWNLDPDGFAHLTYLFGSVTPKVPSLLAQSEVLRALNEWAKITNLTFQQGPNPAGARNIVIKFVSGAHGDAYPFDGPGNSLAHTFYPVPINPETVAGDMHLDADENWHAGGDTDIFSVALHEAGHAIGLGHSDKPGDVMYPYYRSRTTLSANDIGAAQVLYGKPLTIAPAPVVTQTTGNTDGGSSSATVPLSLTTDVNPSVTKADTASLSGTLTGGKDPVSVQWQTANGTAGRGSVAGSSGSRAWNIAGIPLVVGDNAISISAFDSASQSASATVAVNRQSASTGVNAQPVAISIRTPVSNVSTVSTATFSIAGIAAGGNGITRITWQTSGGAAGVAAGTTTWLASGVPLLRGTNTVVVRAWDEKGSYAWASLVVTRH